MSEYVRRRLEEITEERQAEQQGQEVWEQPLDRGTPPEAKNDPVSDITDEAILEQIRSADQPVDGKNLRAHFKVIPQSSEAKRISNRLQILKQNGLIDRVDEGYVIADSPPTAQAAPTPEPDPERKPEPAEPQRCDGDDYSSRFAIIPKLIEIMRAADRRVSIDSFCAQLAEFDMDLIRAALQQLEKAGIAAQVTDWWGLADLNGHTPLHPLTARSVDTVHNDVSLLRETLEGIQHATDDRARIMLALEYLDSGLLEFLETDAVTSLQNELLLHHMRYILDCAINVTHQSA